MADAKRGGGGGGVEGEGRKARKRGKGKVAAFLTLPPQSTSLSPFLPIPYTFRRLLRMLSKTPSLRLTDFVLLYIHLIKVRDSEAIRWLKTPRSLSVHTLIWFITQNDKKRRFEIVSHFKPKCVRFGIASAVPKLNI